MSDSKSKSRNRPTAIQFVSGRAKDRSTRSMIRSHAMSAFRTRQRQQRAQEKEQIRQNATHDELGYGYHPSGPSLAGCGTSTRTDSLSSISQPSPQFWPCSSDPVSTQPAFTREEMPPLLNLSTVDFDPFSSMPELLPYIHSKYTLDVELIKKSGECLLYNLHFLKCIACN
jgi:hypothetical protein